TAFQEGAIIPDKHTCSGQDVSPPLQWSAPPKGTRSFALIMDDPDAPIGTWVHWVMFNIPSQSSSLREGVPPKKSFPSGEHQGINDFKRIGYGGLCPPPGKPHRYYLKLYALDTTLKLQPGATKAEVLVACQSHILGKTELMGLFGR
ncbi:MAG: YbhB/YbcL family Raf kinase inhibitor-like protein, partial [Nitrospirales bacterium]